MPQQTSTQSSFMPHESPLVGKFDMRRGRGLGDLLVVVAIVLFVASSALAVAVFLYQEYLQTSINSKIDQLQRAKAAFEPSLIQQLTRLDDRMRAADQVLNSHIAPSAFFHMLQASTISSISYRDLDFEGTDPQHMSVHMDGIARSVNSIALQADLFSKGGMLSSPIFSNINRAEDGVHFSLAAIMNPAGINYEQLITSAVATPAQGAPQSPFGGAPQAPQPAQPQAQAQPTQAQRPASDQSAGASQ